MTIGVIKLSGKSINDFVSTDRWINTITNLYNIYDGIVIIHGAGKDITYWSDKLGLQSNFIDGQRITTNDIMNVVVAVQAGLLNSKIVAKLNSKGFDSSGYTGIDRNSFIADYIDERLGFVGKPKQVGSTKWIIELLEQKVIPVFSTVCRDKAGNLMNVNADVFTEAISVSINADSVFFVSDVGGVLINGSILSELDLIQAREGISNGEITEGMIPKLLSCAELLNKGIQKIWIGSEIKFKLTGQKEDNTNGTWIINEKKGEIVGLT
jgi:acetylglutamate kinase